MLKVPVLLLFRY